MISSPHSSPDDLVVWERNWTLLQTFLSQRIFGNIWPSIVRSFMKTSFIKCHWHIRVFWHCYLCERQVCYFHFLSNVQRPWFGILKLQNKFVRILESERWWKYKIMRWGNNFFKGIFMHQWPSKSFINQVMYFSWIDKYKNHSLTNRLKRDS